MTINPGDTADQEVERIARAMCKADGLDPDCQVVMHALALHRNGYSVLPPPNAIVKAWFVYEKHARIAINELRSPQSKIELVSADRPVPYSDWIRDLRQYAHDLLKPGRDALDDAETIKGMRYLFEERVD